MLLFSMSCGIYNTLHSIIIICVCLKSPFTWPLALKRNLILGTVFYCKMRMLIQHSYSLRCQYTEGFNHCK